MPYHWIVARAPPITATRSSRNTSTRHVNRVRGVRLRSARRSARDGLSVRTDSSASSLSPAARDGRHRGGEPGQVVVVGPVGSGRLEARRLAGQRRRRRLRHATVVDHVDDDDGDVVATAALVGEPHQLGGGLRRVVEAAQHAADLVGAHLVEQAVGAEEEPVAGDGVDRPQVDVDGLVDAEHPGDDVALRVDLRLLGGDPPLAHEVGHHAVVLGELHERAVAEEVGAAVAHVGDERGAAGGRRPRRRRRQASGSGSSGMSARATTVVPMPRRFGSASPSLRMRWFATAIASVERVGGGLLVRDLERLDGEARRHLAALVPTHAVGDDEEVAVGEEHVGVLVDRAQPSDVGGGARRAARRGS